MKIYDIVLDLIGHTPLVRLNLIKKDIKATILAKLEYYNQSVSVKDRIALQFPGTGHTQNVQD